MHLLHSAAALSLISLLASAAQVPDRFTPAPVQGQRIGGVLGARIVASQNKRLLELDSEALIGKFRQRDAKSRFAGEHIGKFFDAASQSWQLTSDPAIRKKLDTLVSELLATQDADGYLGTYPAPARWKSWDVWVHKYDLLGLLSYHAATGSAPALDAASRAALLLARTFGAGGLDINTAGEHVGMAATSVLEPVCLLYRATGDPRLLEFAESIIAAWERPTGAHIISSIASTGSTFKTANAKAYEMVSNLVGLLELYRLTGKPQYLDTALRAWNDIRLNRLYISGTISTGEHFLDDHVLPAGGPDHMGEGCATVTWMQFNWQLLRTTGEPRFAEEIERTVYNHLLGAEDPETGGVCYYMPLDGRKGFGKGISCCGSSVPRGIAMIPRLAWGAYDDGAAVLLYTAGETSIPLRSGNHLRIVSSTSFPEDGRVSLTLSPDRPESFPLLLRVPAWTARFQARVAGRTYQGTPGEFLRIARTWIPGDRVSLDMDLTVQVLRGGPTYPHARAIQRGPQVLALDRSLNPSLPYLTLASLNGLNRIQLRSTAPSRYQADGFAVASRNQQAVLIPAQLHFMPYMDASDMRVWLNDAPALPSGAISATAFGRESASRNGDGDGAISDELPSTFRRTFDWTSPPEDWFAVEAPAPVTIRRIVFRHGFSNHRGGWFDTSAGKPILEVRDSAGQWAPAGTLDSYPATDPRKDPGLQPGQPFELRLAAPLTITGLRIRGKGSSGPKPGQLNSSCAELSAYAN